MKTLMTAIMLVLLCFSAPSYAAKPTTISFVSKQTTWLGKTYYVYKVGCSNGRHGTISGWNDKKEWCQGKSQKNCTSSRLQAAAHVCK